MKVPSDFDWRSYLELNSDLRAAGLKNERQAKYHYFHYGSKKNYQYKKTKNKKSNLIDVSLGESLIVYNDFDLLKNLIIEYSNIQTPFEIIFGFKESSFNYVEDLIKLQNENSFLHCYGFLDNVDDYELILKYLCLYNTIILYPEKQKIDKLIINEINFDLKSFYSLKKINLGILSASWKRKKLTSRYCEHIIFLKKLFSNHINLTSAVVDSDQINKESIKKFNSVYLNYLNQPLSDKFNFGMNYFKNLPIDYVMILGSDNFIDEILMIEYIKIMRNNYDLIGVLNSYVYDIKTGHMYNFLGYPKTSHRYQETLGAGRILSKTILDSLKFMPWKNGISKGLDGSMWEKLSKLEFKEYKINVKSINGLMLGVKTDTFITDLNKMKNKVKVQNTILDRIKCLQNF